MLTGQKYGEGDSLANSPGLTAQNEANPTLTTDSRQAVYDAQSELLALVDDYVNAGYASGPIQAISELLFH